ncbi:MAG: PAS domain-containing sensor histidine kinase [Deltaproteobacteria bacterium]
MGSHRENRDSNTQKGKRVNDLAFFTFVIRHLPVGVLTVDSHLHITGFNPWATEITGFSEKEALGHFCGDILHGGMCDLRCPLRTVLGREQPMVSLETTVRTKSGKPIPVRMRTSGLFDDHGNLIGGVEAFQDISYQKDLERQRNNFISVVAHDMKSPVISIHGFAHRLLKHMGETTKKQAEYLRIIEEEATRLESLISDFLELSRLQAGELKLNLSAVSLDKEVQEVYEVYQQRVHERGLQLELHLGEPLPIIEADSQRLRRAFSNLLDNAIKYSKAKGTITISTKETDKPVVVEIKDEGIGIDPLDFPGIFDAFHRGEGAGKKEEGFGLGLAGVKAIVEGHGGEVRVESELGKGSVFSVFLPKSQLPQINFQESSGRPTRA